MCLWVKTHVWVRNILIIRHCELGVFRIDNILFVENIVGVIDYKAHVVLTLKLEHTSGNKAVE